jgi:predicted nucleotidyltransferase
MIHKLPDVPQLERLPAILSDLERDKSISAIWLGGSLATGTPDEHSDIDLRLAINAEHFNLETLPTALQNLESESVLVRRSSFGEGTAWHYLMLPDASIWDVLIYRDTRDPFPEFRRVIRANGDWANKLEDGSDPSVEFLPLEAAAVIAVLEQFWLDWRKHIKVLARGRQNVIWMGLNHSRHQLTRLKFMLETGCDCGPTERLTIHTLLPVSRALASWNAEAMGLEELATEASTLGRALAARHGFEHPESVERAARNALKPDLVIKKYSSKKHSSIT